MEIDLSRGLNTLTGPCGKGRWFRKTLYARSLDNSSVVLANTKLAKKHDLWIPYRYQYGVTRDYEVDFLVKDVEKMYLVETKADKDLSDKTVILK